jgi:hypothetical protein
MKEYNYENFKKILIILFLLFLAKNCLKFTHKLKSRYRLYCISAEFFSLLKLRDNTSIEYLFGIFFEIFFFFK